jgi:hypothetical protein
VSLFWLSFCDDERPKGSQFLGVAIVHGIDPIDAVGAAWALGINPGGQVAVAEVVEVPVRFRGRLLSREEAGAVNDWIEKYGKWE